MTFTFKGASSTVGNSVISIQPFGGQDYEYDQDFPVAASTWVIEHNLGRFPSVTTVDSAGSEITGAVTYDNENKITVVFNSATSGNAYLN